jgi:ribosomal protein S27AE
MAESRTPDWRELSEAVLVGLQDWRAAHPRATFAELEAEVDQRLNQLRARMLEDLALASRAADWGAAAAAERPPCPDCGAPLQARGRHPRELTVQGDQRVRLSRQYATCPACGAGVFPPR